MDILEVVYFANNIKISNILFAENLSCKIKDFVSVKIHNIKILHKNILHNCLK